MIKKKEEYEKEKLKKLEDSNQKRKEFFDIIEDRLERREEILEDETILFNLGLNKDNITNLKRLNTNEKM